MGGIIVGDHLIRSGTWTWVNNRWGNNSGEKKYGVKNSQVKNGRGDSKPGSNITAPKIRPTQLFNTYFKLLCCILRPFSQ
jgi:hypothetical protein